MTSPTSGLRTWLRLCVALGMAAVLLINAPRMVDAQGLVKGVQQGAHEGTKAAGPVGGVLGGDGVRRDDQRKRGSRGRGRRDAAGQPPGHARIVTEAASARRRAVYERRLDPRSTSRLR